MKVSPVLAFLLLSGVDAVSRVDSNSDLAANPIRKVVNMLQKMQKKIAEEGKKKEEVFDKYMCYCKNADTTLGQSISDAQTKIPQVESAIKEGAASKKQMEAELKDAQVSRVEAKDTIAKATAIREKEAKAFAAKKSDLDANIGALSKAIPAIEKGMSGAFLQTSAASILRSISLSADMIPADRDLLASFLSSGSEYVPQSGEITGILKTLKDEMEKDLSDATTEENSAIASFESLIASKKKEIEALKKDEWAAYKEMQATEMVALADTIKVLNDDDALELFKKTLPGASSSFVQVQVSQVVMKKHALAALKGHKADPRLDLIELAMRGGKMGFDKIIKMIDNLVRDLKAEQSVDEDKKKYCLDEFDKAEDKKKELDLDISDLNKAIEDAKETIATLKSEISGLKDGIEKLDKSVAEATATRKEEHDDFVETLAANSAAKDLLAFAKNRLNKFYNPKLYKAPPKRELSEEERITVNMGGTLAPTAAPGGIAGTGIGALAQTDAAPPPPPEAPGPFKKKTEENNGVIAMIDLLIKDLDKEMQTADVQEKDAQKEYEAMMGDSAAKRAQDSALITEKESMKAELETELEASKEGKMSTTKELMGTLEYISGLHKECDWLLKYFDVRKEARDGEVEALGKAKAVLSGADYSLIQLHSQI